LAPLISISTGRAVSYPVLMLRIRIKNCHDSFATAHGQTTFPFRSFYCLRFSCQSLQRGSIKYLQRGFLLVMAYKVLSPAPLLRVLSAPPGTSLASFSRWSPDMSGVYHIYKSPLPIRTPQWRCGAAVTS
jgi:hypothetical protein